MLSKITIGKRLENLLFTSKDFELSNEDLRLDLTELNNFLFENSYGRI
ncbi:hypothetical protein GWK08_01350 [Leptobacterium flavescens]|uniref:Uncharacterized protein n=1 Tax=Leptobacterium flavescens TaxID=472055 RepID=A0A6P0UFN5_9FLAO|nr:hypothetical protein [Leptobacterium flavescens]NER12074.1 hypothetical protein [Leptobacterium flavescens]